MSETVQLPPGNLGSTRTLAHPIEARRPPLRFRRVSHVHGQPKSLPSNLGLWVLPPGVFEPEDVAIVRVAYDQACTFLGHDLGPAQRREIAKTILVHARRGLRDPHRLALKAIVAV
jgi:hypothetical protein